MAVNVSSKQLLQPDLVAQIEGSAHRDRPRPPGLELEITESSIVDHPETAAAVLAQATRSGDPGQHRRLRNGLLFAELLPEFTVDTVKIDRSFVGQMGSSESQEIVQAIVTLAHNLKLAVIAEGVENENQRGRLKALECDYVQGYYYSEPLNSAAAAALVAAIARDSQSRASLGSHTLRRLR